MYHLQSLSSLGNILKYILLLLSRLQYTSVRAEDNGSGTNSLLVHNIIEDYHSLVWLYLYEIRTVSKTPTSNYRVRASRGQAHKRGVCTILQLQPLCSSCRNQDMRMQVKVKPLKTNQQQHIAGSSYTSHAKILGWRLVEGQK